MAIKTVKNAAGRFVPLEINGKPIIPFKGVGKHKPEGERYSPPVSSCADYPNDGNKVVKSLEEAIRFAELSYKRSGNAEFPESHIRYLRFWAEVVTERLRLLEYMRSCEPAAFAAALEAWRRAVTIARSFPEAKVFPNHFYSLRDLELEEQFLMAARAFRFQEWETCASTLERLLQD